MPAADVMSPPHQGDAPLSPALEIKALSYSYGAKAALADIELTLPQGRFAVLLGENGAGKTTMFSLTTRLFGLQAGSIRVFGHDIERQSRSALARLGVVFQQRTLDLDLTAGQNLIYHAALHGISFSEARARAHAELGRIGLADVYDRKVRQLSGGQTRRIEIARALMHQPQLLLCDEATVGLDMGSRAELLRHVRALVGERRMTVLWSTHLIDEVAPEDLLIILRQGRIQAQDTGRAVLEKTGATTLREALSLLWENA